ncbi:hypothetical protein MAR_022162, partial [Mya arenaria]
MHKPFNERNVGDWVVLIADLVVVAYHADFSLGERLLRSDEVKEEDIGWLTFPTVRMSFANGCVVRYIHYSNQ